MNTFLPYKSYQKSAKVLDMRRLGKQRVEVYQILKALLNLTEAWKNHPATKMWKNSEWFLYRYGLAICNEWLSRGYKDTVKLKLMTLWENHKSDNCYNQPAWSKNNYVYRAYRSNLLRKASEHYCKFNWKVPTTLPYIW